MKWLLFMLAALLLVVCIACNEAQNKVSDITLADAKDEEKPYVSDTIGQTEKYERQPAGTRNIPSNANQDWEKKIIKAATLNIEAKDYNKYYSFLQESVKSVGGYIAQEDQAQTEYKKANVVVIKVPVAQFDEAVSVFVNGTGQDKLLEKQIASQDVTSQVVDTKSRLEAKRQVRLRYLELLKQARNMGEVLQVQNEINELQEQIEMAAGRIAFLSQSSAYSTINLTFFQVLNPSASIDIEPSFFLRMASAFEDGWNFIKLLLLGIISIWPLLLGVAGMWLGFKKWKSYKPKTT
jgi:hypothetical protein